MQVGAWRHTSPRCLGPAPLPGTVQQALSACRRLVARSSAGASGSKPGSKPPAATASAQLSQPEATSWGERTLPSYLQNSADPEWFEDEPDAPATGELLWQAIRKEAQIDAESEPMLSSFLYASVLAHDTFERSLAFVLANRLANTTLLSTQLFETFFSVLTTDETVRAGAIRDIIAFRERDPSCISYSQALLYYKGYHAIQAQRIGHSLWNRRQRVMALALQSRVSEVLAVDIHPAARMGHGILLDHGTGVVIGETAVIGNNVSLLQNVTLGGTGKEMGDRHPKIADNVLIGASATVLGNIHIGKGAQIAAGSLVLKPVPPHTLVAGSPAKEMGKVMGNPARTMQHWSKRLQKVVAEAEAAAAAARAASAAAAAAIAAASVDADAPSTSAAAQEAAQASASAAASTKPAAAGRPRKGGRGAAGRSLDELPAGGETGGRRRAARRTESRDGDDASADPSYVI